MVSLPILRNVSKTNVLLMSMNTFIAIVMAASWLGRVALWNVHVVRFPIVTTSTVPYESLYFMGWCLGCFHSLKVSAASCGICNLHRFFNFPIENVLMRFVKERK